MRTREWVALGAVMATATAASLAFGEDPTPCYEEYWAIGLARQQVSFDEFRDRYADDLCVTAGRANARDIWDDERFEREDLL